MPLGKLQLLQTVLDGFTLGGWKATLLNQTHPYQLLLENSGAEERILVHLWNVTHGGKTRSADEYRIQITGVKRLVFQKNLKTLLLGIFFTNDSAVITAFDPLKHLKFGSSPSIQVHKPTLDRALTSGVAFESKELPAGKTEVVIAFRPEVIGHYVTQIYPGYHALGKAVTAREGQKVASLDFTKAKLTDRDLKDIPKERRRTLRKTLSWIRDSNFNRKILHVYNYSCAICGLQAKLVQAAHIIPVHKKGLDEIKNGLAFCILHHAAFDQGLIAIDSTYTIRKNKVLEKKLKKARLFQGFKDFLQTSRIGKKINLPKDVKYHPDPDYLRMNMQMKGPKDFA